MEKTDFLEELYSIQALKFGNFTLASGKQSEFYLDLRYIPAFPQFFSKIIDMFVSEIMTKLSTDLVIGIPLAGVPYSAAIGLSARLSIQLLRKEKKEHGLKRMVEGPDITGKRVILVDDLISSGFSKEFAITEIRSAGGIVEDLVVVVDRRFEDYSEWEKKWGVNIHSLFKLTKDDLDEFRKLKSY